MHDLAPDPVPDGALSLAEIAGVLADALLSPTTPSTAKAGISRELRATLADIDAARPTGRSVIDDLADRRRRRLGFTD